jgi:glycosyltransferase involved in cell wall biosynthesis
VPETAFVVGSFQKDGVGWGEGLEPKLIKGPDALVAVLTRLHARIAELFVLLTGPARGYVMQGLERAGIPYRHVLLGDVDEVASAYRAIDVCVVASRDEGGPRAVLESMATGVPLVTTRVGQAADLVEHGVDGWMVEVDDIDALARSVAHVAEAPAEELARMRKAGREKAEANSYPALRPRWRALLDGFVALGDEP